MLVFKRAFSKFQWGDVVMLRSLTRGDKFWMSEALHEGGKVQISSDSIKHEDIVGKKSRNLVKSSKDDPYIVTTISTEDYINLSKRAAQPIYPLDAASIVTLADFHVDYPELDENNQLKHAPLQYLEAGTGHGSLTLAICNKIHAANCYLEKFGQQGAILHSIDNNETHSNRGFKNLKNFKRGIYNNDVKFHLAESPTDWLLNHSSPFKALEKFEEDASELDREEFLSGAFLDMADLVPNLKQISINLKQDSPLIIFSPSVTQIVDVLKEVKSNKDIKMTHIRTVQLVPGIGGGLQDWDVRFVKIKANEETGLVCRPKVGTRVVGGGFVGIFKKLPNDSIRR
jgi:tRNA A58 N-methylase Trm61